MECSGVHTAAAVTALLLSPQPLRVRAFNSASLRGRPARSGARSGGCPQVTTHSQTRSDRAGSALNQARAQTTPEPLRSSDSTHIRAQRVRPLVLLVVGVSAPSSGRSSARVQPLRIPAALYSTRSLITRRGTGIQRARQAAPAGRALAAAEAVAAGDAAAAAAACAGASTVAVDIAACLRDALRRAAAAAEVGGAAAVAQAAKHAPGQLYAALKTTAKALAAQVCDAV